MTNEQRKHIYLRDRSKMTPKQHSRYSHKAGRAMAKMIAESKIKAGQ